MREICPIKNKLETNQMLRAIKIAEVLFWHEGYHTKYLSKIENCIKGNRMYSPKISEIMIPQLHKLAKSRRIPMSKLVNVIISQYLDKNMEKQEDHKKAVAVRNT